MVNYFLSDLIKLIQAIFTAPNEFVLKMTIFPVQSILPTDPDPANVENWKWTVLDLEILVVEYEIGCGSSLMHPAQKQPLIALCQAQICQEQRVRQYKKCHYDNYF
jgi:hypothetical protein